MVTEKVFLAKRTYKSPKQLLCFLPFLVPEEMQHRGCQESCESLQIQGLPVFPKEYMASSSVSVNS